MGLIARGGEDASKPNKRAAGAPPEGEPGQIVTVTILDVFPPLVITAEVQADGYFADEVYDEIAAAKAAGG